MRPKSPSSPASDAHVAMAAPTVTSQDRQCKIWLGSAWDEFQQFGGVAAVAGIEPCIDRTTIVGEGNPNVFTVVCQAR